MKAFLEKTVIWFAVLFFRLSLMPHVDNREQELHELLILFRSLHEDDRKATLQEMREMARSRREKAEKV